MKRFASTRLPTIRPRCTQADLRLSAGVFQSGRFGAGVFAQATWADAKATDTLYGTAVQPVAGTGLVGFNPGSGWLFASGGLLWSVDLSSNWIVVGSFEARKLQGDVARSPLVERASNHYVSAGLSYRF